MEDYALIGDCRSAALISSSGSLDWLCLPQFDSPSVFNRLLDHARGGYFSITPSCSFSAHRAYRDSTAVLMTEFRTESGMVRVTDCMPVMPEEDKRRRLTPWRSVLRYIEGVEGTVPLQIGCRPRPNDGCVIPMFRSRGEAGYCADLGNRLFHLSTDIPMTVAPGGLHARLDMAAGRRAVLWLSYSEDAPAVYPVIAQAEQTIEESSRYWDRWAETCCYRGPYRRQVIRSAVTLKLLSFAPSGAIVAAPTTSLPEVIGGTRNWDYRYCWLRDASYTARVFFRLRYLEEARAFVQWMTHATALTYPALHVMYDVYGESGLTQKTLAHLAGYRGSAPVRTGNQAHAQFQLDVYGEVMGAVWHAVQEGLDLDRGMRRHVVQMAELVCEQWARPDHGFWEIPTEPRQYVHSKVMCWVALDRAERVVRTLGLRADTVRWKRVRDSIRCLILEGGYSWERRSFVQRFDEQALDATALLFPNEGFIDPNDLRMIGTIRAIRKDLCRDDLVYRYRGTDGLDGTEGAFLPCSFWLVEALAGAGYRTEARRLFDRLGRRANDVGLYAEEMDVSSGHMLGNFPQALTHLAHIGAALSLDQTR
ncbi:MAG: hypothetical protein A4E19_13690 [Nitrospira sp. SG-bin1]|nr:MAG: hypothetical protein A4E19_13690 [Nitrospira sp. SG-bin1]